MVNLTAKVVVFLVLFTIISNIPDAVSGEAPGASAEKDQTQTLEQKKGTGFNLGAWLASLFRDHLSAVDSDRCPSIPSCSSYSVNVFNKHGFFVGWIMTVDRLIHEADETSVSPLIRQNGEYKIIDPVENNDFWWVHPDDKDVQ